MKSTDRLSVIVGALVLSVSLASGQQGTDLSARAEGIANWPAPAYWSPPAWPAFAQELEGSVRREGAEALSTSPLPFIGVTPCRVVDTRPSQGFGGAYGPPIMAANAIRTFDINSGPCPGIPAVAEAYSLNFAVTETTGAPGDIRVFPTGTPVSVTSVLNWNFVGNGAIANATIITAGTNGAIDVQVAGFDTHLVIDINGYYAPAGVGIGNTFLGLNAGNFTMTGNFNTGIGQSALFTNTAGNTNTAIGIGALVGNTLGNDNTATGAVSLINNSTGNGNTTAGAFTMSQNTTGSDNTANGFLALFLNSTGVGNTANGSGALQLSTGSNNIGIGSNAGANLTTGNDNICIGNSGVAGESSAIRIGTAGTHAATFLAGIDGTGVTGVPVLVSSSGQLGVASSSRLVKEDIREVAGESDGLMRLRPVAFRYKPQIDPAGHAQYGLIAEEVADVYPDLVAYDVDGQPGTVRYHLVNALLLNEVQKQHRIMEAQERTIEQEKGEIEELKTRLTRLEARLPAD
jgi:hypothetical protein